MTEFMDLLSVHAIVNVTRFFGRVPFKYFALMKRLLDVSSKWDEKRMKVVRAMLKNKDYKDADLPALTVVAPSTSAINESSSAVLPRPAKSATGVPSNQQNAPKALNAPKPVVVENAPGAEK
ncbi:hypothetical protein RvY_02948-2 [Ramazzottius varieornatus]|uniref:Uncharacterized protein n=1 Tax=Ramazzottius varieornatus TaxID=947166 RepID=A0A1D1UQ72_RAMVA|nr:hypothetical protein RvY_02948-2 [Ramazzottius varieornatus]